MLKNQRFILVLLICAALAILISGRAGSQSDKEQEASEKAQTENTNTFLKNKIEEAQSIADTLRLDHPTKLHGKWNYFQGLGVHPTFWTAVDWVPDSAQRNQKTHHLIQHKSGWDLLFPVPSKGYVLTYPLVRFLKGSFHKLNNISPLQNIEFEFSKTAKNHLILDGTTYISYYGSTKTAYGKWFLAGGLILILLAYILAYYTSLVAAIIIACSATLLRYSIFKGWIHGGLKQWVIFDPSIFASSENLPSLGDLLLHIYVGLMLTLTIIKLAKSSTLVNKYLAGSAIFVFGLTAFFGSGMMHDLFKSLILNSNISFDVTNLGSISIFTLVAAVLMAILFWLYFLVIDVGVHLLKQRNLPSMIAIGLLILSSIGFTVFQSVDASRSLGGLFPSILFNVACLCLRCVGSRIPKIYGYLSFVGLVSIFVTTTIYQNQSEREVEYLNLYANKLVTNKDLEAEYMFRNMENELAEEFLQPEDFTAFDKKKEFFEKRLRRLYFSGYLDRYNMLVMSFDSLGTNINSSTLYSFDQLNDIYNNSTFSTISNHFYQVKNSQIFNGYLAKFENCDITGHYGSIFILLEPKFIQSSYEYAALVQKKKERSVFDIDDYSYAIYNRGTLMHQKGSFSYSLHIDTTRTLSEKSFFNEGGYRHFISKHPGGANVLLSTIDNLSLRALSTFSFTFILFTILLLLGGLVWFVGWQILLRYFKTFKHGNSDQYHAHQFTFLSRMSTLGIEQVYLSTRIRFAMVGLVFVGLLISIYVTIQFIRINNFSRAETDLMYRIREIANQLQNEVNLDLKLKDEESE
ncbi:MAG: two-component system nitrogen regulation sensor histidine kinase NtrY, partial [Bacteroidia bacterium]